VRDALDATEVPGKQVLQTEDHRSRWVARRAQDLVDAEITVATQDEVGKRSPDVDPYQHSRASRTRSPICWAGC
jgi:hypothetical protein